MTIDKITFIKIEGNLKLILYKGGKHQRDNNKLYKGTRMVKEAGEDLHGFQTTKLKNSG